MVEQLVRDFSVFFKEQFKKKHGVDVSLEINGREKHFQVVFNTPHNFSKTDFVREAGIILSHFNLKKEVHSKAVSLGLSTYSNRELFLKRGDHKLSYGFRSSK